MADETAESLREMAQHRGLKLVRSRRRKPGTGDFGKFGLTDDKGQPLLGIGEDGLTASADEIENYLRAGAASTWQQSAKIVPDRPVSRGKGDRVDASDAEAPRRRGRLVEAEASEIVPPAKASKARASDKVETAPRRKIDAEGATHEPRYKPASTKSAPKPVQVEPRLILRAAKPADAGSLAKLLSSLSGVVVSAEDVARDLAAFRKAGAGVHVAERGPVVGCIAWSVEPNLQRGPVGRISVLFVEEGHRRRGIGTQLLAVAEAALARAGCALVEVMSDIDIKNSHNFFRTLRFDQTSYRFTRKIAR
ncbi:GNAT family N-acetyltransferase [Sphingobium xenophagum]|uniref:GNAT family N-acetyltransferase n=1 Tax=Sphingobium xenophagum TaxID=121428 RepID=UPI001C0D9739|nr:GNAT family N-acetyltransferase [Sphingobium xenophagum]QWT16693.1 GNAT family N-acetyltransferase [Sphingobium xenophagum]